MSADEREQLWAAIEHAAGKIPHNKIMPHAAVLARRLARRYPDATISELQSAIITAAERRQEEATRETSLLASARLEIAQRHVVEAEARVARQQEIVADLVANGQPSQAARNVLIVMQNTLMMMIEHRDRLACNSSSANTLPASGGSTNASAWSDRVPEITSSRVLVVEDEPLIAFDLEACLQALGCVCVGTMYTVRDGVEASRTQAIDAAIVDLVLQNEMAYPALSVLAERQVPFMIVTGMPRSAIDARWLNRPILDKPYRREQLHEVLLGLLELRNSRP